MCSSVKIKKLKDAAKTWQNEAIHEGELVAQAVTIIFTSTVSRQR